MPFLPNTLIKCMWYLCIESVLACLSFMLSVYIYNYTYIKLADKIFKYQSIINACNNQ